MEKELQRKYFQLQLMRQQLGAMLEEKEVIDERISEIIISIDALNNLGKIKKGEEIWSSLGSGAFIRSDIKDIDDVLVGIGAGVIVKESKEKAIDILKSRLEELGKISNDITVEINRFSEDINKLEPEIQKLAEKK